jgi:hypothetical protein
MFRKELRSDEHVDVMVTVLQLGTCYVPVQYKRLKIRVKLQIFSRIETTESKYD